ncbi:MAG: hypothetical protein ACAI43_13005, partial [Phycisphaerae bacterium]
MPDFLPEPDLEYAAWLRHFAGYVDAHAGELPVTGGQVAELVAAAADVTGALADVERVRALARGATERKDGLRAASELIARAVARQLQASGAVSDAQRAAMNLTVRGRPGGGKGGHVPTTRPMAVVDRLLPLRHDLRIADETPGSAPRARRPRRTIGAEVWVRVAADPGREPAP